MDTVEDLLGQATPELRRYAFFLTGSSQTGDDLVEGCLRAAVQKPRRISRVQPRRNLYRRFHEANPVLPYGRRAASSATPVTGTRLLNRLMLLSQTERAALVLASVSRRRTSPPSCG